MLPLALLALTAADPFPPPKTPTPVLLIGCRQGECQWQRITRIEPMRARAGEALRKASGTTGGSTYRDLDAPTRFSPRIRIAWKHQARTDYVLCSKRRPALLSWDADERMYLLTRLSMTDLPGYQYAGATLYMNVCHGLASGRWSEGKLPAMGYRAQQGDQRRYKTLAAALRALG